MDLDRLLQQSAENLKLKRKGRSIVLHTAANAGQEHAVNLLLQRGNPIDAQYSKGNTPLQVAIINKDANTCQLLLQWGANTIFLNARHQMAHHMALDADCPNILEMILATGVSPDTANSKGETVLYLAMALNNYDALKMLITKGVDLNVQTHGGKTASSPSCCTDEVQGGPPNSSGCWSGPLRDRSPRAHSLSYCCVQKNPRTSKTSCYPVARV